LSPFSFIHVAVVLVAGIGLLGTREVPARDVPASAGATEIRLIARADDMGAGQAINEACIQAYTEGIVRSVEVIVPGPWFLDAVRLLKQHPDLDIGVHLTLTSEWDRIKWRPLTHAPSLVDADGYFFPTTRAFTQAGPKPEEVERELRAQIDMARRLLGNRVSHVSAHMGAATATPELKGVTAKLAKEYNLRTDENLNPAPPFGNRTLSSDQRERALMAVLEKLPRGDWLMVEHPGYDTPETRAMGHQGYENVATDRSNVRRALTSERVKKIVKQRGIKLIGYNEL
jgi:chitin disaccharide deacetylase